MEYVLQYCDEFALDYAYTAIAGTLRHGASLLGELTHRCAAQSALSMGTTMMQANSTISSISCASLTGTELMASVLPESLHSILPYLPDITQRDDPYRQFISITLIAWLFGHVLYHTVAWISFHTVYDKNQLYHPRFLPNQIELEKRTANIAMGPMALITAPWFFFEVRGYSKLYDRLDEYGWGWLAFSPILFLFFTDMMIYWVHRGLHHPYVYGPLHKLHHKWIIPTPYASHAFHFLDGYAQSLAYHVFVYLFPLHKGLYLLMFAFVNVWTILIHDGEYFTNNPVINGAAHHTVHHEQFNYNYGQYFTLWDRIGGTYRAPEKAVFERKEMLKKMLAEGKLKPKS
jgi:lathosterol oxidase